MPNVGSFHGSCSRNEGYGSKLKDAIREEYGSVVHLSGRGEMIPNADSYCEIDQAILMPRVMVGRYSRVRRAILDEGVVLPENSRVGFDMEEDRSLGRVVTESGITVVPSPPPAV